MALGWRMRDRLRASVHGMVVGGVAGKRVIPWSQVRRVEVVGRKRMGTMNHSLEVDDPTTTSCWSSAGWISAPNPRWPRR